MSVRNLVLGIVGIVFALWMGAFSWLFGFEGPAAWWYLPFITLPFAWLQLYVLRRMNVAERRGYRVPPKAYVALILSWVCALGFGFTAPDWHDGEWVSVLSLLGGDGWIEMSIALCNPLGIIAFSTVIAALIFSILAGRDPRPSEDDLLDAAEQTEDGPVQMVDHPLKG